MTVSKKLELSGGATFQDVNMLEGVDNLFGAIKKFIQMKNHISAINVIMHVN